MLLKYNINKYFPHTCRYSQKQRLPVYGFLLVIVWMAFRIPSATSGSAEELKPFRSVIIRMLLPVIHGHSDQNSFLTNLQWHFLNYKITQSEKYHWYYKYRTHFISFLLIQAISLRLEGTVLTNKNSQHIAFMCKVHINWYINAMNQGGYLRRRLEDQ